MVDNIKKKKVAEFTSLGGSSKLLKALGDYARPLATGAAAGAFGLMLSAEYVMEQPFGVGCVTAAAGAGSVGTAAAIIGEKLFKLTAQKVKEARRKKRV